MISPRRRKGAKKRFINNFHFSSFLSRIFYISYFTFILRSVQYVGGFILRSTLYVGGFLILFISCGPAYNNQAFKKLSTKDQNKYQKYLIQGRDLYKTNCASCHQTDGNGLKKLIPPLANSDYLKANQVESIKLIRNGATKPITVNGIAYTPTMPAHPHLTNLEIAEIITYINNSWGNEFGFVDGKLVGEYLK